MLSLKQLIIALAALLFLPGCSGGASYTKDILLMDTFVRIELKGAMSVALKKKAADKAASQMQELARRFDYFREDSELSKGVSSPEMRKILKRAEEIRKLTKGAFDIRIGPGGKINLGGIAKGFIVDEGISVLREEGAQDALINAGGDMYCMGTYKIGIRAPRDPREIMATLNVTNKGLATSGGYERGAHIIDPRTGEATPETRRSVTVIADDCMTADALATALYVLGTEEGLSIIENLPEADCVIVEDDGEVCASDQMLLTEVRR